MNASEKDHQDPGSVPTLGVAAEQAVEPLTGSDWLVLVGIVGALACAVGGMYYSFRHDSTFLWWFGFVVCALTAAAVAPGGNSKTKPENTTKAVQEAAGKHDVAPAPELDLEPVPELEPVPDANAAVFELEKSPSAVEVKPVEVAQKVQEEHAVAPASKPDAGLDLHGVLCAVLTAAVCVAVISDIGSAKPWPLLPTFLGMFFRFELMVLYVVAALGAFFVLALLVFILTSMAGALWRTRKSSAESASSDYGAIGTLGLKLAVIAAVVTLIAMLFWGGDLANKYNERFGARSVVRAEISVIAEVERQAKDHTHYSYRNKISFLSGSVDGDSLVYDVKRVLPGYARAVESKLTWVEVYQSWVGTSVVAFVDPPKDLDR